MSRTQIVLKCNDKNNASRIIEQILDSKRYDHVRKDNEDYWKQGVGVTQSPKFIRYYFDQDNVILEGWVSNFGKESNLEGFIGALPKNSCRKVLNEIRYNIENLNNQTVDNINSGVLNANDMNVNLEASDNQQPTIHDSAQLRGRMMIKEESGSVEDMNRGVNESAVGSNMQSDSMNVYLNNPSGNNAVGQNKSTGGSIIPRRYRGSILTNIFEIVIGLVYLFGASTGYLVLRFTDSSEALMVVALIILIHGVVSLISNLSEK